MAAAIKYLSINDVVKDIKWTEGLKESMISDFVKSGYGNVAPLIGSDNRQTSQNIQKNIIGFASGKNTYLQADMLAVRIEKLLAERGSSTPKRGYTRRATTSSYPMGDVIKDCAGWTIYKKTLPDGRIVYNAKIKPETPPNKTDWNAIKGDVYTSTKFKWGKFGAFERWGEIEGEEMVVNKLCEVLAKYYQGGDAPAQPKEEAPEQVPESTPQLSTDKIAEEVMKLEYDIWDRLGIESGGQLRKDEDKQEKYADEVRNVIIPFLEKYSLRDSQRTDLAAALADDNAHNLNNSLSLIGYYGDDTKQEAILDYSQNPDWWLNPKYYITEEKKEGKSKEDIEKAIKGLQYLADKGNEQAKKAIKGLQYLLNK